jgi:iron complex outermembrane recepter protein
MSAWHRQIPCDDLPVMADDLLICKFSRSTEKNNYKIRDSERELIMIWRFQGLSLILLCFYSGLATASQLEEVIVTASKRQENLQDVSVAVTAISAEVLSQSKILQSEDLVYLVPSLNLQKGMNPRSSSFNIRGIGTQSFSAAVEPSVSTVLDGVVMGRSGMAFTQLFDISRVEVLRGPQGTLFGKNASGGVVHYITEQPADTLGLGLSTTYLEDEEYRAQGYINTPISDELALRLSGSASHQDGWIENVFDGSNRNESDDWALRGQLRFEPTENLSIIWASDYSDKDCECSQQTIRSADPDSEIVEALLPVVPGEENTKHNDDGDLSLEVESFGHRLNVDWNIGEFTLTSITAYREWDEDFDEDVDNSPEVPIPGSILYSFEQEGTLDQDQFSQEFRLLSPSEDFISYVVGLYYFEQTVERGFARTIGFSPETDTSYTINTVDTENFAAFGELTINVLENVRGLVGVRYTDDDLETQGRAISIPTDAIPPSEGDYVPGALSETDETDTSFKFGIEWDVADDVLAYVTFAEGYKGPAFNAGATNLEPLPAIEPETSDAYELGLKSQLFDGRLTLNIAVFSSEFTDFQAEAFVPGDEDDTSDTGEFLLSNAGEVETQGIEIDFSALPMEQLYIYGSASFIDAEIKSFEAGPCGFGQQYRGVGYNGQVSCDSLGIDREPGSPRLQDLSGGSLPFTPDWKFNLGAAYTVPIESKPFDVVFRANLYAQDKVLYSIDQDERAEQNGYELVDMELMLASDQDQWSVSAFVKNVFDEFYVGGIGATTSVFVPNGYLQQVPKTSSRTFGVEFQMRWGG